MTDAKPEFDSNDFFAITMCLVSTGACIGLIESQQSLIILVPVTIFVWATCGRHLFDKWS